MEVTKDNYHEGTIADFKGLSPKVSEAIMMEYLINRRKKSFKEGSRKFSVDGKTYTLSFASENKSSFWKSRSKSFYFIQGKSLIRISDHWSKSLPEYSRSQKLNCGFIRSCYWTCMGKRFSMSLPNEKYDSVLIGGKCAFKDFQKDKPSAYQKGGRVWMFGRETKID